MTAHKNVSFGYLLFNSHNQICVQCFVALSRCLSVGAGQLDRIMEPSVLSQDDLWCQSSGRQISDQSRYHKPELAFAELGGVVTGGVIFQIVTDGR